MKSHSDLLQCLDQVAPFAGAWIEMVGQLLLRYVTKSLPSRERGLKSREFRKIKKRNLVAPFAGAWIEMLLITVYGLDGLVAPFAGAWIEIKVLHNAKGPFVVAPFAGAWIEIISSQT